MFLGNGDETVGPGSLVVAAGVVFLVAAGVLTMYPLAYHALSSARRS